MSTSNNRPSSSRNASPPPPHVVESPPLPTTTTGWCSATSSSSSTTSSPVLLNRLGRGLILGCGIWIYICIAFGKLAWVSTYFIQPILSVLSNIAFGNNNIKNDKAVKPLLTMTVPILFAGMMASIFHVVFVRRNSSNSNSNSSASGTNPNDHPQSQPPTTTTTNGTRISSSSSHGSHRRNPKPPPPQPPRVRHNHKLMLLRKQWMDGYQRLICQNTNLVLFVLMYLPFLLYTMIAIRQKIPTTTTSTTTSTTTASVPLLWYNDNYIMADIANVFGIVALYGMSLVLIPVTRYSSIVQYFHNTQHPVLMVQYIHTSLAYGIMGGVVFHVGFHIYRWYTIQQLTMYGLLQQFFVIPSICYPTTSSKEEDEDEAMIQQLLCPSNNPFAVSTTTSDDCTCYGRVRNVMGCTATVALFILSMTSFVPFVRRNYYTMFYIIHCVSGPIVFVGVMLHWNRSIIYLAGNVLYYIAGTFPIWMVQQLQRKQQQKIPNQQQPSNQLDRRNYGGGIRVTSIERIVGECHDGRPSNDVIAVTIETTKEAIDQYYHPGQYIRMYVPSISVVSHPFTINQVLRRRHDVDSSSSSSITSDTQPVVHELRILFRCVGPFTKQLANALLLQSRETTTALAATTVLSTPVLYVDGFYGPQNRTFQIRHDHDHVVFVAGGIGITPYISLLHQLLLELLLSSNDDSVILRKITFFWICRDQHLIDFVRREYFDPIIELHLHHTTTTTTTSTAKFQLQIHIHKTTLQNQQPNGGRSLPHSTNTASQKSITRKSRNISYTNLEQQPNKEEEEEQNNASNLIVLPLQRPGDGTIPFVPSNFFPGPHTTIASNVTSFVMYVLIVWIGLAFTWYLYTRYQTGTTILPRLWAPIVMIVHGYVVTRGMYWLILESSLFRHRNCRSAFGTRPTYPHKDSNHESVNDTTAYDGTTDSYSSSWMPIQTTDDENMCQEEALYDISPSKTLTKSSSVEMGMVHTNGLESSHWTDTEVDFLRPITSDGQGPIAIHVGRPTVHQILNHFDNTCNHPGLYVCGPFKMMRHIRKATKERNSRQCRCMPPSFIVLYEESFEM